MAEERKYELITILSNNKHELEEGEFFLRIKQWRMFRRLLFNWIGKELETALQPIRYKRSLAQNRWLWGICVQQVRAFIKETEGVLKDDEEVYVYLNTSVLGNKIQLREVFGEEVIVMSGKKFSKMNTKEFSDAVDAICKHFEPKGLIIRLPNNDNLLNDHIKDE